MRSKIALFMSIAVMVAFLSLNIVSAEIILNQPNAVYNLGDSLEAKATVKLNQEASGFFEFNLECENVSKNFYRFPLTLKPAEQKTTETSFLLTSSFFEGMSRTCFLEAKFLSEQEKSQSFKISDEIDVVLNMEGISIEAGKEIEIKGKAVKENGKLVEGFAELFIYDVDIKTKSEVKDGVFVSVIKFPSNAKSKNYNLYVNVYEKFNDEKTNLGGAETSINLMQTAAKISIETWNKLKPENYLPFTATILDQAGDKMDGDIAVKISNPQQEIVLQKIIDSGRQENFFISGNSSPGNWKIEASFSQLKEEKSFYVEESAKADFRIVNNTLIITNIGNIIYRKPVQISIGNVADIKNIDLEKGESITLKLNAPKGNYGVAVSDGENELKVSEVALTGKIIGITELKSGLISDYSFVWLFLILISAFFILAILGKVIKKRVYAYPEESEKVYKSEYPKIKKMTDIGKGRDEAEHTLVLKGNKEEVAVLAVKIEEARADKTLVKNIFDLIAENKGVVHKTPDFIIGLFIPTITRTFDNYTLSIKLAKEIESMLKEHNKKFAEKINCSIALNAGSLIVGREEGRVKFTSLDNTLSLAKRIAEISEGEVLLSENMQKKVMSEAKTEKEFKDGINFYRLKNIIERDRHKEFIRSFLERNR